MDPCQVAWGVATFLFLAVAVLMRAVRILSNYEGAVFLIWPGEKYRVTKKHLGTVEPISRIPISTIMPSYQPTPQNGTKKPLERERRKILEKIGKMIKQSEGRIRDQLIELQVASLAENGAIGELNGVFQAAEKIFRSERELRSRKKQESQTPAKSELTVQDYVALVLGTRHTIDEEVFTQIFSLLPLETHHQAAIKAILSEYLIPESQVFYHQSMRVSGDWIVRFARKAGVPPKACREAIHWFIRLGVLNERKLKGRTAEGGWLDLNHDPGKTPFDDGKMIIQVCNRAIRQIMSGGGRIKENLLPPL